MFRKVSVYLTKTDQSPFLDSLRSRNTLDAKVVESILKIKDDDARNVRLLYELGRRASSQRSNFLNSLYLSLLDSCESSYYSSGVEHNFDAAKHVRRECKFNPDIHYTYLLYVNN